MEASAGAGAAQPEPGGEAIGADGLLERARAVANRQDFGALLSAVAGASRISVGAVKTQLGGTRSVYDWFSGKTLPRDAEDARRLADLLGAALARRYPDAALAAPILEAWQRLADRRQESAAVRALANRRAGASAPEPTPQPGPPDDGETPDAETVSAETVSTEIVSTEAISAEMFSDETVSAKALPAETVPDEPDAPAATRRRWTSILVAIAAVLGFATAFGITRAAVAPDPEPALSCAESANVDAGHGFVQWGLAYGPPGDPYPKQHTEMRIQVHQSGGWIVYATLAKPGSDRDRIRLEWSDVRDPDDDRIHRCDGREVNLVQQTPGVFARGRDGTPRWFRACGTVPAELQWPGRGLTACTSWIRPDDY